MKKPIILLIVITLIASALTLYIYLNKQNSTVQFVNSILEQVDKGNEKETQLSKDQVKLIKDMLNYSDTNNLSGPKINIKKVHQQKNKEELLVLFEIIQYRKDNQIEKIYAGSLLFTLIKASFSNWKVSDVRIMQEMQ